MRHLEIQIMTRYLMITILGVIMVLSDKMMWCVWDSLQYNLERTEVYRDVDEIKQPRVENYWSWVTGTQEFILLFSFCLDMKFPVWHLLKTPLVPLSVWIFLKMYIFFNNPLHTKSKGANSNDWTKTEFGFCCLSHPEPAPSLPASPLVPSLSLGDVISGTSITFPATGFLCCCFSNRLTEIEFARHTIHPFKMYSSVVFGLVTETCNHHHSSISLS